MIDSNYTLRAMTIDDYDSVRKLWEVSNGVTLRDGDSREGIEKFLVRNPDLSIVIEVDSKIVGSVLVGHDGRRGFLWHMAVAKPFQGKGFGKLLEAESLRRLNEVGIDRCYILVYDSNTDGIGFWLNQGWEKRSDLNYMAKSTMAL